MHIAVTILVVILGLVMLGLSLSINIPADAAMEELQTGTISDSTRADLLVWNILKWGGLIVLLVGCALPYGRKPRIKHEDNGEIDVNENKAADQTDKSKSVFLIFSFIVLAGLLFVGLIQFDVIRKPSPSVDNPPDFLAGLNRIDSGQPERYPSGTYLLRKPQSNDEAGQLAVKISYEQRLIHVSWSTGSIFFLYPDSIKINGDTRTAWVQVELFDKHKDRGQSEKWQVQFDCGSDRMRWNAIKMYSGNLLTGKTVEKIFTLPTQETPVEPRTSYDHLMEQICQDQTFEYTNLEYRRSDYCDLSKSNFSCTHDWILK